MHQNYKQGRKKWLREEGDEHEMTEKTLLFSARYDPGKTVWEFKPAESKGTLNDERKNAKMCTGDSRNRKKNYRLPSAHLF